MCNLPDEEVADSCAGGYGMSRSLSPVEGMRVMSPLEGRGKGGSRNTLIKRERSLLLGVLDRFLRLSLE